MRRVARALARETRAISCETTAWTRARVDGERAVVRGGCARGARGASTATRRTTGADDDDDGASTLRRRFSARKIVKGITRESLCAVVADVDQYSSFVPFCAGARRTPRARWGVEREREALARGEEYFEADLEIGFKLFNEKYTSAVTCARPEKVTATSVSSGLFRSMTTTWTFSPLDDDDADGDDALSGLPPSDGVVVDFEIDFEVKDPMHAAAVSVVFDDVARSQIQAFEKRCRQLALENASFHAKG